MTKKVCLAERVGFVRLRAALRRDVILFATPSRRSSRHVKFREAKSWIGHFVAGYSTSRAGLTDSTGMRGARFITKSDTTFAVAGFCIMPLPPCPAAQR